MVARSNADFHILVQVFVSDSCDMLRASVGVGRAVFECSSSSLGRSNVHTGLFTFNTRRSSLVRW